VTDWLLYHQTNCVKALNDRVHLHTVCYRIQNKIQLSQKNTEKLITQPKIFCFILSNSKMLESRKQPKRPKLIQIYKIRKLTSVSISTPAILRGRKFQGQHKSALAREMDRVNRNQLPVWQSNWRSQKVILSTLWKLKKTF